MAKTEEPTAETPSPPEDKDDTEHRTQEWMRRNSFCDWRGDCYRPPARRIGPYRDKGPILILDNAACHRGMADDYKSPPKTVKAINAALLGRLGMKIIPVPRDAARKDSVALGGSRFPPSPDARGGPFQNSLNLRRAVLLGRNQGLDLLTWAEGSKGRFTSYPLYTPPFSPDFEPIGLFWARAKG